MSLVQGDALRVGRKLARKLAVRLKRHVRTLIVSLDSKWLAQKRQVDREFDGEHGVDTGGIVHLGELDIDGAHRAHGVSYIASDPGELHAALSTLQIAHEDFSFVDLGSGKGRALLLASAWPFRRIVGVEFSPELHTVAAQNVARYHSDSQRCARIDLHCMDATEFQLPAGPLVIFLYNPFDATVMRKVAQRVVTSHARRPREIYVVYTNPFEEQVWIDAGFSVSARGDTFCVLRPPAVTE